MADMKFSVVLFLVICIIQLVTVVATNSASVEAEDVVPYFVRGNASGAVYRDNAAVFSRNDVTLPYYRPPSWPLLRALRMPPARAGGKAGYQLTIPGRPGWRLMTRAL